MSIIDLIGNVGIVPVVVIENADDAVETARALQSGGVNVMEITLRTAAGIESIRRVSQNCPDVIVGAGTVLSLDQGKQAVDAGAKFIVSPGLDETLVQWCVDHEVLATPGCVTPTEITRALTYGLKVLKFFPANVYGGVAAMKALSGPFGSVKFIPTGGINASNMLEYMSAPFVHAIGGSWICEKGDIASHNFECITQRTAEAVRLSLGFEVAHIGINLPDEAASAKVVNQFEDMFGFTPKMGNSSNFAGDHLEIMKSLYLGKHGHLAISTTNINRAIAYLANKGIKINPETAKYKGDKMVAVYLEDEVGDYAIHLLQK
ncbi:MAG: bifunctional 4-hydroxy-2-oxoglutarate aldolase/2-dehydro-3-deoxy-phosphogluconate aldolase [Chloroflexi bacterium]|nr:bifunctional 4-hydroxy-2-oxoglutarate aldolase/2-dehydro-3-deoxy-phosphogluconate aldolase [Chloroflexota bacterium]